MIPAGKTAEDANKQIPFTVEVMGHETMRTAGMCAFVKDLPLEVHAQAIAGKVMVAREVAPGEMEIVFVRVELDGQLFPCAVLIRPEGTRVRSTTEENRLLALALLRRIPRDPAGALVFLGFVPGGLTENPS